MRVGKGPVVLTAKDRRALEAWVDRPGVPLRQMIRAWIVLLSAAGHSTEQVCSRLGVSHSTVLHWKNRFVEGGFDSISDDRKIAKPRHSDEEIRKIIEATRKQFPANARRWSIRNMAKLMGVSRSTVQRIWKAHGLKPHEEAPALSDQEAFYASCREVAGLYIESSQVYAVALLPAPVHAEPVIQDQAEALRRKIKRARRPAPPAPPRLAYHPDWIQDIYRAACGGRAPLTRPDPNMLDFLRWIDRYTPPRLFVHLLVPRLCAELYPHYFRWLKRHPRFQPHFISKEQSARRFLSEWYERTCRTASLPEQNSPAFDAVADLEKSMREYLDAQAVPGTLLKSIPLSKPFCWVRPDRNYLTDEKQLELNFISAY